MVACHRTKDSTVLHASSSELYHKLEPAIFAGLASNALHVLYHKVSTDVFDLWAAVAGADGDHGCTASEPSSDPARGILKDDAVRR